MTIHELHQYRYLKRELQDLESRIARGQTVSDIVIGSSAEYPYTQHPITVCGVATDQRLTRQYSKQKDRLVSKCLDIEQWMDSVDDSLVRQIIRYKFLEGLSWHEVECRIGGGNKADSLKKKLYRYIDKSCPQMSRNNMVL